jgi:hypothetical protein
MTRTEEHTCEACGKVCGSKAGLGVHRAKHQREQRREQRAVPETATAAVNGADYAAVIADLKVRRDALDRLITNLEAFVG